MQPVASTSASSGLPAGFRRKQADDMNGQEWSGLVGGLLKFFAEEAQEPEHAGDAVPNGAGVLFVTPQGEALFLKRSSDGDHPGEWCLPGGGLDGDEDAAAAAKRETLEETGHAVDELEQIDRRNTGGTDFVTFVQPVKEKFDPKLNGEHVDFTWTPLEKPPQPLHPGVEATLASDAEFDESKHDRDSKGEFTSPGGEESAPGPGGWSLQEERDYGGRREGSSHGGSGWDPKEIEDFGDQAVDDWGPAMPKVDADHDGPWLSCMSLDRKTMYRNKNVPAQADIDGKTVNVDEILWNHEGPEVSDLENLMKVFKKATGREPTTEERKVLYNGAHLRSGTPNEKSYCEQNGINWKAWSAWCRGEEAKVEKGPFTNEPKDADIKPIPHGHGDLAATDSAPGLAFDRGSVREMDRDGRMRIDVSNISKANICPYLGEEIPGWEELGLEPTKIYKLLRDADELEKAAPSFNGVQLLKAHKPVSADDHQMWDIVGTTGSDASFEAPYLRNSLFIWTQEGIDLINDQAQKELSCGYHYKPDMTPGTFEGESYDGVMRDIVGNHVALVKDGRAGSDVVVGDGSENIEWAILAKAITEMAQ